MVLCLFLCILSDSAQPEPHRSWPSRRGHFALPLLFLGLRSIFLVKSSLALSLTILGFSKPIFVVENPNFFLLLVLFFYFVVTIIIDGFFIANHILIVQSRFESHVIWEQLFIFLFSKWEQTSNFMAMEASMHISSPRRKEQTSCLLFNSHILLKAVFLFCGLRIGLTHNVHRDTSWWIRGQLNISGSSDLIQIVFNRHWRGITRRWSAFLIWTTHTKKLQPKSG